MHTHTHQHKVHQRGQSIIEVLIATMVVVMVLTAIAGGLSYSIKNTAESKYRTIGAVKAQEAVEVFRRERNLLGWESFVDTVVPGATYCFNTLPSSTADFSTFPTTTCTEGVPESGTEFTRQVEVTTHSPTEIRIEVTVWWYDGDEQREVMISQDFRQYN